MEPYFEEWELKERVSAFDKGFNISEYAETSPAPPLLLFLVSLSLSLSLSLL